MVTSSFEYHSPTSVAEAADLLARHGGGAKLLAGGHSLIPLMKTRLAEPEVLIDLGRIDSMSYIRESDGGLAIGAMTKYVELEGSDLRSYTRIIRSKSGGTVYSNSYFSSVKQSGSYLESCIW